MLCRMNPNRQFHCISWKNMENENEHGQNDWILHRVCAYKTGCVPEHTVNEKMIVWMDGEKKKLQPVQKRDVPWQKTGEKSQNITLVYGEEMKYLYIGEEEKTELLPRILLKLCKPTDPQPMSPFCSLCFA